MKVKVQSEIGVERRIRSTFLSKNEIKVEEDGGETSDRTGGGAGGGAGGGEDEDVI